MKRWLPWVLLAVSLALNIFFVAGFFWTRGAIAMWHDPERRQAMVSDRLDLTEPQRAQLRTTMEVMRSKGLGRMEHRREMRREILEMALQPAPDRAAILARMEEMSRQRIAAMGEVIDAALPFLTSLTPEQRAALKEMMEGRHKGGWMHRWGHEGWADHPAGGAD